ncbi:MAG: asparagine synthase (glutamine-hydrolyzing) [Anaerolineae bacterium]|nr:asparagine synthase (glutamine-hydrolyzing) [Anaerolineae bacterium]MDW8171534.1 asparagine synthase (glutamine-hydrolyzing) [Anaerolineae bacterium]
MCGIIGQVGHLLPERFAAALASIAHRGPDGQGQWTDERRAWLGQRRLAIVDLSERGLQPMTSEDGQLWAICNGEIYNYPALRRQLEAHGHVFASDSDSEVLLHAYEAWGDSLVDHLVGMYAFALWDQRRQRLLLARDRLGIKPLYYAADGARFSFASEAQAVNALRLQPPALDLRALAYVLTLGYVPAPLAIWRGVHKLPPGHLLVWQAGAGYQVRPYYDLPRRVDPAARFELDEWRALWEGVVHDHLLADVPIGLFLSGGLDSSAVALALARVGYSAQAITIALDSAQDESPIAAELARHLGLPHTISSLAMSDVDELVNRVACAYDEPQGYGALLTAYRVSALAAQGHKVILAGDGGDEVFGGYTWHHDLVLRRRPWRRPPWQERSLWHAHAYRVHWRFFPADLPALLGMSPRDFTDDDMLAPFRQHHARALPQRRAQQRVDLLTFCADSILAKVDRASMAHALEVRVPFLDHRVVEYGLTRPIDPREDAASKPLLRDYLRGHVPPSVLDHPKQGFSLRLFAPNYDWDAQLERLSDSPWIKSLPKGWRATLAPDVPNRQGRIFTLWMVSRWADAHLA